MATVEVITSVKRRRRWSHEQKLRIVAQSTRPDQTASQVARTYGIAPSQLFIWRRQLLAAAIAEGVGESGFVPVRIAQDDVAAITPTNVEPRIEIRLPSGVVIGVEPRAHRSRACSRKAPIAVLLAVLPANLGAQKHDGNGVSAKNLQ
jgi:transposase